MKFYWNTVVGAWCMWGVTFGRGQSFMGFSKALNANRKPRGYYLSIFWWCFSSVLASWCLYRLVTDSGHWYYHLICLVLNMTAAVLNFVTFRRLSRIS